MPADILSFAVDERQTVLEISLGGDWLDVTTNRMPSAIEVHPDQVDDLILDLIAARGRMIPEKDRHTPLEESEILTGADDAFVRRPPDRNHVAELLLRHPGLGWLGFPLTLDVAKVLIANLSLAVRRSGQPEQGGEDATRP